MRKNKFDEENEFNEIVSENSSNEFSKIKNDLAKLISNDIKIIAKNESQKKLINSIKNNEITICAGPAGTGKSFTALAYALSLLRKNNKYKTIYLVKSVKTLKDEELGFIKGDIKDKLEPTIWSFNINMEKLISKSILQILFDREYVKPVPLAYIRGASLDDCIIVADEVQNITLDNSRTLMTRIGSNCKLILLGDTNQIDLKNKSDSSLGELINIFKNIDNIGIIEMSSEDTNVRNPIINIIESKFKEFFSNKINKRKITTINPITYEAESKEVDVKRIINYNE